MAMSAGTAEGEPMMDINTTPLIDVMLVLLIMFIITIPIQTHAVKLDLPVQTNEPPPEVIIDPVKNVVNVNAQGQILWNGAPARGYLPLIADLEPFGGTFEQDALIGPGPVGAGVQDHA